MVNDNALQFKNSIKPPFHMITFVRKEVGMWKKEHFNLVSWTLERLCVLLLKSNICANCQAYQNSLRPSSYIIFKDKTGKANR